MGVKVMVAELEGSGGCGGVTTEFGVVEALVELAAAVVVPTCIMTA